MTRRLMWRTPKAGDLGRLGVHEEFMPDLAADRIRIKTRAIGLNFADIFALAGLYSATPRGSFVPGLEFSGTVEAKGKNVSTFKPGDAVMGVTRFGGYASWIDAQPSYCRPLPKTWSFAQGAAFPVQTLTAWYALKILGNVQPGQTVLVHSAAGGVELQAFAICRLLGVDVVGTVGREEKKAFLASKGFHRVVVRDRRWVHHVRAVLGERPLDLVLDAVGGKVQRRSFDLLSPTGRLVIFGAAGFSPGQRRPQYLSLIGKWLFRPRYDSLQLLTGNRSVMGFNLIWLWDRIDLLSPLMDQVMQLDLPAPHVGRAFSFADAPQAVEWLRSGRSVGKIVLTI